MSYPLRLFLLFIAMPVDAFTGVVLNSYQIDPFVPLEPRPWGPSAVNDLHEGGAVMWVGGAAIMFVLIMVTFFQWTRETRASASMGWLETARRVNMADRFAEANSAGLPVPRRRAARAVVQRGTPTSMRTRVSSRPTTST